MEFLKSSPNVGKIMTSNLPPIRQDLSPAMVAALISYAEGRPWHHLSGRSMHGGASGTVYGLSRRGLFDPTKYELTPDGWMEAHALVAHSNQRRQSR
ncbi:hypothetical protein [Asticcacaulis sp.]|uniref:hypothetical protein n=1 Tax=Asticcacaulis sp. TaxID=1872648 RepID=UPI00263784DA|nr:hypothetical protein [Asticcacaulis sp.]